MGSVNDLAYRDRRRRERMTVELTMVTDGTTEGTRVTDKDGNDFDCVVRFKDHEPGDKHHGLCTFAFYFDEHDEYPCEVAEPVELRRRRRFREDAV